MNRRLLKLEFRSLKHRKTEILRSCLATFFALFFICGVLLLQENIYQWQMVQNKQRFGDWFLRESTTGTGPSEALVTNAYLSSPSSAVKAVTYYSEDWKSTNYSIGFLSNDFLKQGNITLDQGSWPQSDNEIVMDYNTLIQNGYSTELGQTITLRYYVNDVNGKPDGKREEAYTLCGIVNNYSTVWQSGNSLPTFLVTENVAKSIQETPTTFYIYALKSYVKTDDYETVYNKMIEPLHKRCTYNGNVYNYKPWGSAFIYSYMYILVMLIGIVALTYQIWSYQRGRILSYHKMRRFGATKKQIILNVFLENLLILLPAGVIGVEAACLTGKAIALNISGQTGMDFYYISAGVLLKCVLSLIIATIVQELLNHFVIARQIERSLMTVTASLLMESNDKKLSKTIKRGISSSSKQSKVNRKNITMQIHKRLVRENGIGQNIIIRLFALAITVILILCMWNIKTAYDAYVDNKKSPDIIGFKEEPDQMVFTRYYYFCKLPDKNNTEAMLAEMAQLNKKDIDAYRYYMHCITPLSYEEWLALRDDYINESSASVTRDYFISLINISFANSMYLKEGNTSTYTGVSEDTINEIKSMAGVSDVSLSSFDTSRSWLWGNQNLDSMGGELLCHQETTSNGEHVKKKVYGDRYLFATEYVDPTEKLYQRLSKYIDADQLDYNAFCNGDQAIVFLQETPEGTYDETLKTGDTITLRYNPFATYYMGAMSYENYSKDIKSNTDIVLPFETYNNTILDLPTHYFEKLESQDTTKNGMMKKHYDMLYQLEFDGCAKTKAAAVVKLTDEIKEDLSDVLVDYGQYTAIASTALAKTAIENQTEIMKAQADDLNVEVPEGSCGSFQYNQLTIVYDLSSTFSATDNILQAYLKSMNFNYVSYSAQKETYRIKTLNAILQYGVTMIAAIVVDLLIGAILVKNRLAARKNKLRLMVQMGSGKSRIRKICLLEVIRESLWCIFTAPLKILIQYLMYYRDIRKL